MSTIRDGRRSETERCFSQVFVAFTVEPSVCEDGECLLIDRLCVVVQAGFTEGLSLKVCVSFVLYFGSCKSLIWQSIRWIIANSLDGHLGSVATQLTG